MPHLVQMQADHEADGVTVVGVTPSAIADVEAFVVDMGVNYPVLANAGDHVEAWGVDVIWGSTIYLVPPQGGIVAEGLCSVADELGIRFPGAGR